MARSTKAVEAPKPPTGDWEAESFANNLIRESPGYKRAQKRLMRQYQSMKKSIQRGFKDIM